MRFDPHAPELDSLVAYLKFRGDIVARPYRPGEWSDGVLVVKIVDEHALSFPAYRGNGTRELSVWRRTALLHVHTPTPTREPHTHATMHGVLRAYTGSFGRGRPKRQAASTPVFTAGDPFEAFRLATDSWLELALDAFEADGYSRERILKNTGQRGQLPYRTESPETASPRSASVSDAQQLDLLL